MTTPRIEEKTDIAIANLVFSGLSIAQIEKIPKWLLENIEKNKPQLRTTLTEAYQAGIDVAVEIVKKQRNTDSCIGISGLHHAEEKRVYNQALDDTIKALQTKK